MAALGWNVFPVWSVTDGKCDCRKVDCDNAGKHPCGRLAPKGLHSASISEPQIADWWADYPEANIGVVTGDTSAMFVTDIDMTDADGLQQLKAIDPDGNGFDGFDTIKSRTGSGGGHLFFALPADLQMGNATKVQGTAIDIRGTGGYVVVPPSENGSGSYQWDLSPEDAELADCPDWLLTFITGKPAESVGLTFTFDGTLEDHPGTGKGDRNNIGCRLIGAHIAEHGLSNDTLPLAMEWGKRCKPALSAKAVQRMVTGIAIKHLANDDEKPATLKRKPKAKPKLVQSLSSSVEEEELRWLWENRFLIGHVNMLAGDPGLGKSLIAVDASARVSTGTSWPDGSPCELGKVVFCTTEDAFASVVKPRLSAAGADHNQITFIEGVEYPEGDEGALFLDEHIGLIDEELTRQKGEVRLVIFDTLQSYVGDNTNTNNNASSRRIMTPLKRLAEKHQVAVLCLEHLTKGNRPGNTTYRVQGSIAFTGAARAVWIVVPDPKDKNRRIVQSSKTNLSPDDEGLGLSYHIEGEVGRPVIVWEETNLSDSLADLMAEDAGSRAYSDEEAKGEFARACEWLKAVVVEPILATEIEAGWKSEMLSRRTVMRAKKHLMIESRQQDRQWHWMPPPKVVIGSETVGDQCATDES